MGNLNRNSSGYSNVLILAPVGAYISRVKKGVEGAMAQACDERTEVEVIFVLGKRWAEDKNYLETTQILRTAFLDDKAYATIYRKYSCSFSTLEIDDEESSTKYLVEKLASFFNRKDVSAAYIDATSAPIEWIISCMTVMDFFDSTYLYYVRARRATSFSEYSRDDILDEGLPFEVVGRGNRARELSYWLTPGTENWMILQVIFKLAAEWSANTGKPVSESSIEVEKILEELMGSIQRWRSKSEDERKRGLSKYLSSIDGYRLFERSRNYIHITPRGVALGHGLFPGAFTK